MSTPRSVALPPRVTAGTIEVPNGPLAVLRSTPVDPHGTVVLVPGYTGSKEDFLAILEPIADGGYEVIAYDQRGQHESFGDERPESYTVEALARELVELLQTVGPAHVVGHSFGGLVARAAALQEPTAMLSLTLLSSGPAAIPGARAEAVRALRPVLAEHGKDTLWQVMTELSAGEPPQPPEVAAFLQQRYDNTSGTGLLTMGDQLLEEPDRTAELAATGLPLLVGHGDADDAWPPTVQTDMAQRLGARHVVIADAVHSPAVERPEATVVMLLDFWAETAHDL